MPQPITRRSWRRARQIFEDGLDLSIEKRESFIRDRCAMDAAQGDVAVRDAEALYARIRELFRCHDEAQGFISSPAIVREPVLGATGAPLSPDESLLVGTTLGTYRLNRVLGQGGMGVVFLAERSDESYRKRVAIKLLRAGGVQGALAERFRTERQILADLEHPNIAKLLDGGTAADGRPYLVMEYVDGTPIDTYCNDQDLGVRARLELFVKVAGAVGYAHRQLVVHRDLKPSNILVDYQGEPKLLDFGIAKLLDGAPVAAVGAPTELGQMLMTPEYASPEQVNGEPLSVVSDVYSLGVVLYELLAGRGPYRLERHRLEDVVRAVCQAEPPRPSSVAMMPQSGDARAPAVGVPGDPRRLRRQLQGDLDAIVLQALRKEPEERYASVDRLVLDIENQLAGRPVSARRDTLAYRCAKFVRRHRLATALGVTIFLAMSGLLLTLAFQRQALLRKQEQLVKQRNRAESVSGFIVNVFAMPDPTRSQGEQVTARDLLDRGVRQIETSLATEPGERADLLLTMGRSYMNLGLLEEAEPLLSLSIEMLPAAPRVDAEAGARAKGLLALAKLHSLAGRYQQGLTAVEEAVGLLRRQVPIDRRLLALALARWGRGLERMGDHGASSVCFREALALSRAEGHGPTLAAVLDRFAMLESERAAFARAEAMFRESMDLWVEHRGTGSPEVALARNNLGLVLTRRGVYAEAQEQLEAAEAAQASLYDDPHPHLATTLGNLGLLYTATGHFDKAEAAFERALSLGRAAYRGDHPTLAGMLHNQADLAAARGDDATAERRYRQALESRVALLGEGHPDAAATLNNLARMLRTQGRNDEARVAFEKALRWSIEQLGEQHPQVAAVLNNLAEIDHAEGALEQAGTRYRRALAIGRATLGPTHPDLAGPLHNLAALEQKLGHLEAAEQRYEEALAVMTTSLGEDHLNVAMTRTSLASLKEKRGDSVRAETLSRQGLARFTELLPADNPWATSARRILARSLQAQGRFADAEAVLVDARDALTAARGAEAAGTVQIVEALRALREARVAAEQPSSDSDAEQR